MLIAGSDQLGSFPRAVATDAVTKLGRFRKLGTASQEPPTLSLFYREAQAEIEQLTAEGTLNLEAAVSPKPCDDGACPLRCARAFALEGKMAVHGVIGIHGVRAAWHPIGGVLC